jgi:manganese/zinc/iron transport system ATP- binding protein
VNRAAPALEVANLTVTYHARPVLRSVAVAVPAGSLTGIIGPNGAGKSTLFKAALGLLRADSGEVRVFGEPVREARRRIAYIPQSGAIDWDFPVVVRDVVAMGRYPALGWFRRPGARDRAIVDRTLREVGMPSYADRHIRLLSGGQQQRVFIARALAQEADLLFLDEPFVGVDAATQDVIFRLIARLKRRGRTVVMINHDLGLVRRFDHVILLNQRVIAEGPPRRAWTRANIRLAYGGRLPMTERAEAMLARSEAEA